MHSISYSQYLAPCCDIARQAGGVIMTYFNNPGASRRKADNSPVTDADVAANRLITEALRQLTPDIPIIAEEDEMPGKAGIGPFWLVDPLDGTRSFLRGEPEFTVNIGLVERGRPLLGVIYAPPQQLLYYGEGGGGAFKTTGGGKPIPIRARAPASDGLVVVSSKSHSTPETDAYLAKFNVKERIPGSSSIKFCLVAEGSADLYPRFGRTMEWDTAAGHAILSAAGGRVETAHGQPISYGKPGFENPHFIAFGK